MVREIVSRAPAEETRIRLIRFKSIHSGNLLRPSSLDCWHSRRIRSSSKVKAFPLALRGNTDTKKTGAVLEDITRRNEGRKSILKEQSVRLRWPHVASRLVLFT